MLRIKAQCAGAASQKRPKGSAGAGHLFPERLRVQPGKGANAIGKAPKSFFAVTSGTTRRIVRLGSPGIPSILGQSSGVLGKTGMALYNRQLTSPTNTDHLLMTDTPSGAKPIQFDAASLNSREAYEQALREALAHFQSLPPKASEVDRARVNLDIAQARTGLGETEQAWELARHAFDVFIQAEAWQDAVEACEVMYQTGEPAAAVALSHGVWLGVTYPIAPQTTITMLNYIIDETPEKSDGAAVAAAAAHYIASIRASDEDVEDLTFLTRNMLARVAERHSAVTTQDQLDSWMVKLELRDPAVFLPRMGKVLDIIVMDQWWIDRDALRSRLPVN